MIFSSQNFDLWQTRAAREIYLLFIPDPTTPIATSLLLYLSERPSFPNANLRIIESSSEINKKIVWIWSLIFIRLLFRCWHWTLIFRNIKPRIVSCPIHIYPEIKAVMKDRNFTEWFFELIAILILEISALLNINYFFSFANESHSSLFFVCAHACNVSEISVNYYTTKLDEISSKIIKKLFIIRGHKA